MIEDKFPGFILNDAAIRAGQKFAVFDIDGTLYRGNLTWDFFKELTANSIISRKILNHIMPLYDSHDKREVENAYHVFDAKFIEVLAESVTGIKNLDDYWKTGEAVGKRNSSRLYTYTRDLLEDLRNKDYTLIAITHSIGAVAHPFAVQLGFDAVLCSEEVLGYGNTKIIGFKATEAPRTKGDALGELMHAYSLPHKLSVGIGDTLGDASILELVDEPIAFNPDQHLRNEAIARKWPIIIERKDTIYRLCASSENNSFSLVR